MRKQELEILEFKAKAFDSLVDRYLKLRAGAGFYSSKWVEVEQVIEAVLKKLEQFERNMAE